MTRARPGPSQRPSTPPSPATATWPLAPTRRSTVSTKAAGATATSSTTCTCPSPASTSRGSPTAATPSKEQPMPAITNIRPVLLSAPYAWPDNLEVQRHLPTGYRTIGLVEVTLDDGTTGLGEGYLAV